ncbi:hypothetical protein HELRODRAFT_182161 [Helobdella robusta]|uniref:Uncharacterized protein n=1 Tax=Helobdella robusta TaxID=6412 RepID=T1FHU7_HELRO|nr:hypothetical protein HELRODRAFT_182161 [Helobdella robusta]ESN91189.1 hypothetical protein HELRODRAFT_182161 [Helobdella robusta]
MEPISRPGGRLRGSMIMPTLIQNLKNILEQYPDDGQILKEIIQNAEDAKASKVVFLIDMQTYGTNPKKLFCPELAMHQGPALYAYNDAILADKDWDGIRKLGSSNKVDDPLQVGRFGLGFKSVFHLTDLPGIYSGDVIGFLDPHEKYFHKKSIYTWDFTYEEERNEILTLSDQFSPFKQSLFNVNGNNFHHGRFNGTIFRFPLRKTKSELSDKCCSENDLRLLFYSLEKESHLLLLFLKNIESIECYKKYPDGSIEEIIKIKISESVKSIAKLKRKELLSKLESSFDANPKAPPFSVSYPLSLEVSKSQTSETTNWIITQHFNGHDTKFNDKNYLPLVGIATKAEMNISAPYGQIFCFLPLPLKSESPTGFNFHIHASFALEQNRRHIKHVSADQDPNNISDKDLLWNQFLLSEVFSKCLIELITFLIGWHSDDNDHSVPFLSSYKSAELKSDFANFVYSLMPNMVDVNVQWRGLVESFYKHHFNGVQFYSNCSSAWLDKRHLYFLNTNDEFEKQIFILIMKTDKKENCAIPIHLLNKLTPYNICILTNQELCKSYKRHQTLLNFSEEAKLKLLKCFEGIQHDLIGTDLLPLMDSTWTTFQSKSATNKIFILDGKYDEEKLFPMQKNKFLDKNKISKTLLNFAQKNTQVCHLDEFDFADLVRDALADFEINNKSCLTIDWLETVWKHLRQEFPNDLSKFDGLRLLPINERHVVKLSKNQCILQKLENLQIKSLCKILNLTYIEYSNCNIYSHSALKDYTLESNYLSVIKLIIHSSNYYEIVNKFTFLENGDKLNFLIGIAKETKDKRFDADEICLLKALPIFQTIDNGNRDAQRFVSIELVNMAPDEPLYVPVPSFGHLLDINDHYAKNLAKKLGVQFLSHSTLIDEFYLKPVKEKKSYFSNDEIQQLLKFLSQHIETLSASSVLFLTTYPFITTSNDRLVSPSQLFDPSEKNLSKILSADHFPSGDWAKVEYIKMLKCLKLKNIKNLSVNDFEEMAKNICKSTKFLELFNIFMDVLTERIELLENGCLRELLMEIECFPVETIKSQNYPESLRHKGKSENKNLACYHQVYSTLHENLIGSDSFLINSNKWPAIETILGWSSSPPMHLIKSHLFNIVQCFNSAETHLYMNILHDIYKYLNKQSKFQISMWFSTDFEWIWNGEGFSSKNNMILNTNSYKPYIHSMPPELNNYDSLWKSCEIQTEVDPMNVLNRIRDYHVENAKILSDDRIDSDLNLAVQTLKNIANNISRYENVDVCIPIKTNERRLAFELSTNCAFCDEEWYKLGFNCNDLDANVFLIHEKIPIDVAKKLNVPNYVSKYLNADEFDCEYEQSEELTVRIKNLLKDYTDGLAIFKELIQNADDAKASEISFVYDQRQNLEARSILFDEKMKDLQGPAIWCHNNATFTDRDFDNLIKLGGATKEGERNKIGKFGLGFNSVYHLTDVPMFVSNQNIVFFDPHRKYLGKAVHSKSCAGIKLHLKKHKNRIEKFIHQFMPFHKIFSCDFSEDSKMSKYDGTLFRFPLRTEKQASESLICNKHYNSKEVRELIKCLFNLGENLIMFTRNIRKIQLFSISNDSENLNMEKIFTVERNVITDLVRDVEKVCNIFKPHRHTSESEFNEIESEFNETYTNNLYIIEMKTTEYEAAMSKREIESYWIVSWCHCSNSSFYNSSTLPIGSVAGRLITTKNKNLYDVPEKSDDTKSYIYSFLPVSLACNFPVHVNGNFSLNSSRTHLHERDHFDKEDRRCEWNEYLMTGPVAVAYCHMLHHLAKITTSNIYDIFPVNTGNRSKYHALLTESVYKHLLISDYEVCKSVLKDNIFKLTKCLTMDLVLRNLNFADSVFSILQLTAVESSFTDLPVEVLNSILHSKFSKLFSSCLISPVNFYKQWFLPHMSEIPLLPKMNVLIETILNKDLKEFLLHEQCIPATPFGDRLLNVKSLIDPECELAELYDPNEERFPFVPLSLDRLKYYTELRTHGMTRKEISCEDIIDRCRSIENNPDTVCKRLKIVIEQIRLKVNQNKFDEFKNIVQGIRMFEKIEKPKEWILSWKISNFPLVSIEESYLKSNAMLPAVNHFIINEKICNLGDLKLFFDLKNKTIPFETMKIFLNEISNKFDETDNYKLKDENYYKFITDVMSEFNQEVSKNAYHDFLCDLKTSKFILAKDTNSLTLVSIDQCCLGFHPNLLPYICSHSDCYSQIDMKTCKEVLGMSESFKADDYVRVLNTIKSKFNSNELDEKHVSIVVQILSLLAEHTKDLNPTNELLSNIPIINENNILTPSNEILYNNLTWNKLKNNSYCNSKISRDTATKLKLKYVANNIMSEYKISMPFGQHENLVDRLNTILTSYNLKEDVLKEMLQNADDSNATEVHFIRDERQHGTVKIFDGSWQPQQGPALCIYNNKSFSEQDLEGIQKLGRGSKRDDVLKTGHFGVGFNSVYQITDVPSFITTVLGEKNLGTVVGFFDPNCKFLLDSDKSNPGGLYKKEVLAETFTDVYSGFLQDFEKYDVSEGGTIFRLPLRNAKSKEKSEIKQDVVYLKDIKEIFNIFETKICESLIFLKSITSLSLVVIDEKKHDEVIFNVKTILSKSDATKKSNFIKSVKNGARNLSKRKIQLHKVQSKEIVYRAQLTGNDSVTSNWVVVQRFGFENTDKISEKVKIEYSNQNIPLLPLGGVAIPANSLKNGEKFSSKIFNLLPLAFETNLPCHIDGNFVMSHEGRRDLLKESCSNETYKSEWNELIFSQIIVPAYCSLLMFYKNDLSNVNDYEELVEKCNKVYYKIFPSSENDDFLKKYLVERFYQYIHENKEVLFLEHKNNGTSSNICWISSGKDEDIYFDNVNYQISKYLQPPQLQPLTDFEIFEKLNEENIKNIITNLGMRLISCPYHVYKNFVNFNLDIKILSPTFIKQFMTNSKYLEGKKVKIHDTVFKNPKNLKLFLKYLTFEDKNLINGLPVLLSADEHICTACPENGLFESKYAPIFPHKQHQFVHPTVEMYFKDCVEVFEPNLINSESTVSSKLIVKELTILEFKNFLNDFEPIKHFENTKCIEVQFENVLSKFNPPEDWLLSVWKCIESLHNDNIFNEISNFSILPVEKFDNRTNATTWFYPISKSLCVLKPLNDIQSSSREIFKVLKNLGLPILKHFHKNSNFFSIHANNPYSSINDFMDKLVVSVTNPSHVLKALSDACKDGATIKFFNSKLILKYFSQNVDSFKTKSIDELKKLSMFCDVNNTVCALNSSKVVTIPSGIPQFPIEKFPFNQCIYLKRDHMFDGLYKRITSDHYETLDFYAKIIFPNFDTLNDAEKLEHLKFIKSQTNQLYDEQNLKLMLKNICFLKTPSGQQLQTSKFYSKNHCLFNLMEKNFPSSPYDKKEWNNFLKLCGLNVNLSSEKFIEYAFKVQSFDVGQGKIISSHLLNSLTGKTVSNDGSIQSEAIELNHGFVQKIKQIPFIVPHKIDETYLKIHDGFSKNTYIKISDSKLSRDLEYYWTACDILPPIFNGELLHLSQKCSLNEFDLNLMISHMKKTYGSINEVKNILFSYDPFRHFVEGLTNNYLDKLKEHANLSSNILSELSNLPIIFVNSKENFVQAHQCAIDITEKDQIPPYIFKLPSNYGPHAEFLMKLGASKHITIEQCIKPLETLKNEYGNSKLKYDDLCYANKLFDLFLKLLTTPSSLSVKKLFIPCKFGTLESSELVVCLNKNADIFNGLNLSLLGRPLLKHKLFDRLMHLPENIRPKLFSDFVRENISSLGKLLPKPGAIEKIEEKLNNINFKNGFEIIINKAISDKTLSKKIIGQMFDDEVVFECYEHIELVSVWGDDVVEDSKRKVYFHPKSYSDNKIVMCVNASSHIIEYELVYKLSEHLIGLYVKEKKDILAVLALEKILNSNLDKLNILLYECGYEDLLRTRLFEIKLGVEIPLEDHFTLMQDDFKFFKQQLVAYEEKDSFDDDKEGDPKYILVQIIEIVGTDPSSISSDYEVDFGQHRKTVPAVQLFSFAKVIDPEKLSVVLMNPENETSTLHTVKVFNTLKEAIDDLKQKLKEIWKLDDEAKKKKAIKRLFLKWHPDKNPTNFSHCNEVFKHLQILIQMLEDGKSIDDYYETTKVDFSSTSRTSSSYFNTDYFDRMSRRAQQHSFCQKNSGSSNSHSSGHFSYRNTHNSFFAKFKHVPTKKPKEAKLFLDQANYDFNAASNDAPQTYQWMCVKYYMVVQNSLKAVQCMKDHSKLSHKSSSLSHLATELYDADLSRWSKEMDSLLQDLNHLTTPSSNQTASDKITCAHADQAKEIAENVFKKCSKMIS